MRVWIWEDKEYGEVGASRWMVEWYTVTPAAMKRVEASEAAGKEDEYDPVRDVVCNDRPFPPGSKGRKSARAFAKRMAKVEDSAYGCARLEEQVVSNDECPTGYGEWVKVGESEDV